MALKLVNVSVVVLSEGNNPRLLNPDFLERNRVVPKEWKVADVLVTPPFAQVVYENGIQFTVEMNKLQFQTGNPDAVDWEKTIPGVATTYLALLPHVTYRAVGINFVFVDADYPERPFAKLLNEGPWLEREGGITGAAIELHYRSKAPEMNVKIGLQPDAKAGKEAGNQLTFTVNYHHNFDPDDSDGRKEFISSIGRLKERFLNFAGSLPFVGVEV